MIEWNELVGRLHTIGLPTARNAADAITDLQAENQRLRDLALKAYTVVEWVAGDGFILEMPHEDADDLMLEMAKVLGVESSIEARAALRNTETNHDD